MELLLIVIGVILSTAILFMVVERIRGDVPDDDEEGRD